MKKIITLLDGLVFQYGLIEGRMGPWGTPYRRNRFTRHVQFIMWRAGEQGHTRDFWIDTDPYWFPLFTPLHDHSSRIQTR